MSRKLKIIFFIIAVILVLRYGVGLNITYGKVEKYDPDSYDQNSVTLSSAFFDFKDQTLKTNVFYSIYLYRYSEFEFCFTFGCGPLDHHEKKLFNIATTEYHFKNNCWLKYKDLSNQTGWAREQYDRDLRQIDGAIDGGYVYLLHCDKYMTGYILDNNREYSQYEVRLQLHPTTDIQKTYPETLGLLVKKGIKLPTRDNQVVLLTNHTLTSIKDIISKRSSEGFLTLRGYVTGKITCAVREGEKCAGNSSDMLIISERIKSNADTAKSYDGEELLATVYNAEKFSINQEYYFTLAYPTRYDNGNKITPIIPEIVHYVLIGKVY